MESTGIQTICWWFTGAFLNSAARRTDHRRRTPRVDAVSRAIPFLTAI